MAVKSTKLGPGTLTLGGDEDTLDVSCQLLNGVVSWDNDTGDDKTVLCGDVVKGARTYTSTFSGKFMQDIADAEGLVAFSWANKGEQVPFEYVPNTTAGTSVAGELIIDPLDVGTTEDYGTPMESDFEWDIVGDPVLAFGGGAVAATGATAGTPGTWTPSGSTPPATSADAGAVTANPATAWTSGQYVQGSTAGASGEMHWDGAAWAAGRAA